MVSQAEARRALADTFLAGWGTRTPALGLGNETLTSPGTGDYVKLVMQHTGANQSSLAPVGNRKFERRGQVVLQIYTDANAGERGADDHVDFAKTILEAVTIGTDLHLFAATPIELGSDGHVYQTNLQIPFMYEETR